MKINLNPKERELIVGALEWSLRCEINQLPDVRLCDDSGEVFKEEDRLKRVYGRLIAKFPVKKGSQNRVAKVSEREDPAQAASREGKAVDGVGKGGRVSQDGGTEA